MRVSSDIANRSHKEVRGCVSWTPGEQTGEDDEAKVTIPIYVQPDFKLPTTIVKAVNFDLKVDCHPFWHIRRSRVAGKFNCELHELSATVVHTSAFKEVNVLNAGAKPGAQSYLVKIPCIVNTKRICAADEVVLKWHKEPTKRTYQSVMAEAQQLAAIANRNLNVKQSANTQLTKSCGQQKV